MYTAGTLKDTKEIDYGFGWRVQHVKPFGKLALHSGGWPGYKTYIERNLDSDKTIIFLENNDNPNIENPIELIREILYNIKVNPTVELSEKELKVYAGDYKTKEGGLKSFFIRDKNLYIKINDQVQLKLKAVTKTTFIVIGFSPEVVVEFFIENGIAVKHIATQEGRKVEATRVR